MAMKEGLKLMGVGIVFFLILGVISEAINNLFIGLVGLIIGAVIVLAGFSKFLGTT